MTERRESYAGQVPQTRIEELEEENRCLAAALEGCRNLIARLMSDAIADQMAHPLTPKYEPREKGGRHASLEEAAKRREILLASLEPDKWYRVRDFGGKSNGHGTAVDDLMTLYTKGRIRRRQYNKGAGGRPLYEYGRGDDRLSTGQG